MQKTDKRYKKWGLGFIACVCGVGVNILGSRIATMLELPFYFDSVGTILISALSGYIPGIIAGFTTNIINGLSDYTSAYYSVINVLLAITAAWFSRQGFFKKPLKLLLAAISFAVIGGGIGSVLTWFLYGMDFGAEVSAPLAHYIYESGLNSAFLSQLSADLLIDLADKGVTVLLVALILRLLPQRVHQALNLYNWLNAPKQKNKVRLISLGAKIMILISIAVLLVSVGVTFITFHQFHDTALENQYVIGDSIVRVAASFIDGNRVEDYITQGEKAEGYLNTKQYLYAIMKSSPDIQFVYAYRILEDGCHVVFDLDTDELEGEDPGTLISFDEAFADYLPDLLAGKEIKPVISDETYGWLLTFYCPVYDDAGKCQCYAAVDISMPRIIANEQVFMTRIISLFLSFFILLLFGGVFLARHHIVVPINRIAAASQAIAYNSEEEREKSVERLRKLNIHTGDEIENLYASLLHSSEETMRYIAEDQEKNEKINKLQSGMISVLAEVVESRDKCTGDHVKKTAAYAQIVMEQMRREGVFTDQLTDEYIQDVVNSAPLHDVGKIHIPDSILNKPGRLTDEEYKMMKEHPAIGADILRSAIDIISSNDTGYLKEARNLAYYHHERWDGKGYPFGLSGEDIPLSARVMAVADVFDALVSKRSYKDGFSFEKAMGIIQEGSGTQFDPRVAAAFKHAEDKVRLIAEEFGCGD